MFLAPMFRSFLSEHFVSKDIVAVLVDTYVEHKELMFKHIETGGFLKV